MRVPKYRLKHVDRFESVYSIRLYELLVQRSSAGEREIKMERLKNSRLMINMAG
jgi:plasmid replication initiation protein